MTQRRHITLVAAGATVLAALPLAAVFDKWTWLVGVLIVVVTMAATAVGLRTLHTPNWVPTAGMIGAYLLSLTWLYGDGKALFGILPSPATFLRFNELLVEAGEAMRQNGVPIEDHEGLLFLAALGIGAVLLAVDLAAVVAHRPAIAGAPMVAIYLVVVGTNAESVSFLPFACTAAAFLWLLATDNVDRVRRFGRRFTGDGRDVDVWDPSPLAAAGRRLAVVGVAVAVAVPILVPGMTTGLLDRFGSGVGGGPGAGGAGGTGAVSLFSMLSGSLTRNSPYEMVRVTTNDPAPFYLRIGVAEELTANGFINRPGWGPGQAIANISPPTPPTQAGVVARNHRADVEILNFTERLLPMYMYPTKVERLDNQWLWDRRSGVLYSTRTTAKNRKYSFNYTRFDFTPDALRTSQPLGTDNQVRQQYTRLPSPQIAAIRDKAAELTAGKPTPYDKVRAVYDFFSPVNGFRYSLTTPAGNSGSAMVDFLNNKIGYCEQYAAAMAWLVRATGIPARVAFGWTKGSSKAGNTYTLNNFNLHAWTEVYFDGFGWVPFDATPASSVAGSVPSSWAPDPTAPTAPGAGVDAPDDLSVSGGASAAPSAIDQNQFGGNDPSTATPSSGLAALPRWPLYAIGATLAVALLLALPALQRSALRRRRWPGRGGSQPPGSGSGPGGRDSGDDDDGDPGAGGSAGGGGSAAGGGSGGAGSPAGGDSGAGDSGAGGSGGGGSGRGGSGRGSRASERELVGAGVGGRRAVREAHDAWDELIDTMVDFQIPVNLSETPRITAGRVVRERMLRDRPADGIRLLSRAEEHARYARSPLRGTDLGPALRDVRSALRHGVSRRTLLRAVIMPPSVLARWRAATVSRYTDAVNAIGRRRDAVVQTVSPRRLFAGRSTD